MDKAEQVMAGLWEMFNKRTWLDAVKMKERLKEYNPSEIHCMDAIANLQDPNVTKLADDFYMTRSAISKLTRKLMEKGLIESYRKPDNRKEIYFRLTAQGMAVNAIHEALHKEYRERDKAVFAQITDEQYDSILRFVAAYTGHLDREIEKLGVDRKAEGFDRL